MTVIARGLSAEDPQLLEVIPVDQRWPGMAVAAVGSGLTSRLGNLLLVGPQGVS